MGKEKGNIFFTKGRVFLKNSIFTIPNLLSVFRLCLIPFITTTYYRGLEKAAVILLTVSGVTDLLDGFIARRFHQISNFGKLIDPIADKLTTASVVFVLMLHHSQICLVLIVLVVKELLMLAGALSLVKQGARPAEAKLFGKLSTAYLYLFFFTVMIFDVVQRYTATVFLTPAAMWFLSGVACVLMICAVFQYTKIFIGIKNGTYNIQTEQFEGEISK